MSHLATATAVQTQQSRLFQDEEDEQQILLTPNPGPRSIEDDTFPFESLSDIAEIESWRKEINRPVYHIHKWWAQRLGSVFRAIVTGTFAPQGSDLLSLFYEPVRIPNAVVFDPFMGSGTTLGESLKLGTRAIGRDINPVAHFLVRNALAVHNRPAILRTFADIEKDVANDIRGFYRAQLPGGVVAEVLYYFWVKQVTCPACSEPVDLFPSYLFACHAYPKKFPEARAICPYCPAINTVSYNATSATCCGCHRTFDPQRGPANGQTATCQHCEHRFSIAKTVKAGEHPPAHRLYAKLVLLPDGSKTYLSATEDDQQLYAQAKELLAHRPNAYPVVSIAPGYNTNQVLGYNYRQWHEMFNARQLLCLSFLADRIRKIEDTTLRELFTCLFSGTLEFNNMFASYKGEGTGAVRHMFAHHILKPERMPLEANVWGTSKSSGSFSTLFEGRIRRALDSAARPFELRLVDAKGRSATEKVYDLSESLGYSIATSFSEMKERGERVYLSCGDSSHTDLPNCSVDAVITDPPFFDNVYYSELADFFHVWQRHVLGPAAAVASENACTTRSVAEVQNGDVATFTDRLSSVLKEAHRVLKDEGLFVFSYHHSRQDGWRAVLQALMQSGFRITASQPIKSEMSIAMPKQQAKEPIDLDIIIVCRKRGQLKPHIWNGDLWTTVAPLAQNQIVRFRRAGRLLSRNDLRIIIMGQLLRQLSLSATAELALALLDSSEAETEQWIDRLNIKDERTRK